MLDCAGHRVVEATGHINDLKGRADFVGLIVLFDARKQVGLA
jgi:hypothetical protein